jgi:hypothetical protein
VRLGQIFGNSAGDPGLAEPGSELVRAGQGRTLELAQHNLPVAEMLDNAWSCAVQADEAQTAHDLLGREQAGELLLVPQSVLQGQHRGRRVHQRRQQSKELVVGRGLEPDEDEVGGADFLRASSAPWPHREIALRALDAHSLAPDDLVVRPEKEMDLMPGASKLGAVKAPHRPAADDGNLHKETESWSTGVLG